MLKFQQFIIAACVFSVPFVALGATPGETTFKREVLKRYATTPILFQENRGQAAKGVDFLANGIGRGLVLRGSGVDIYLPVVSPAHGAGELQSGPTSVARQFLASGQLTAHPVSIRFVGGNPASAAEGLDQAPSRSSFMIDGHVTTGVLNYRKIRYSNVWPGIDVLYYGNGRHLEYDLVLHPGADPKKIRFAFSGVDSARSNAGGDLVLHSAAGDLVQHSPHIYQEINGAKIEVAGEYRVNAHQQVAFKLAKYDRAQTLVIDPTLTWEDSSIDPSIFNANGIATDNFGFSYVVGQTLALNNNFTDLYLFKLNSAGQITGSFEVGATGGNTLANAVSLDPEGNIYVVGQTAATGLIQGCNTCGFQNALANAANTHWDGFLVAFSYTFPVAPSGSSNSVNYVTYMGGSSDDEATGVAAAGPNAVYVAGTTTSSDFPRSQGPAFGGIQNAFLVKVDTTQITGPGSKLWAEYVGGTGTDAGTGVAIDLSGDAYIVGTTNSLSATFFPYPSFAGQGFNASKTSSITTDGFLDKIDPSGTTSLYLTYLTNGPAFAVATTGTTAYVVGSTPGALGNITGNAAQPTFGGGSFDAFLFRIDTTQSGSGSLLYSTYLGGAGTDQGTGVAADVNGNAYISGATTGSFPIKNAIQGTFGGGAHDPFYSVINTHLSGASSLVSATYLGSANDDIASGVSIGPALTALLSGSGGGAGQAFKIQNSLNTCGGDTMAVDRSGTWFFDFSKDRQYDGGDFSSAFGQGVTGQLPIIGPWSGPGAFNIGIYINGAWYVDTTGDDFYDAGDQSYSFGFPGGYPVVGDWSGNGVRRIGVMKDGVWYVDVNNDHIFDTGDTNLSYGITGDYPIVADWTSTGRYRLGVYRGNGVWVMDTNGNNVYDSGDQFFFFGFPGAIPVVGDWTGDGKQKIGVYDKGSGQWYLDLNANGSYDAGEGPFQFGIANDQPVVLHCPVP